MPSSARTFLTLILGLGVGFAVAFAVLGGDDDDTVDASSALRPDANEPAAPSTRDARDAPELVAPADAASSTTRVDAKDEAPAAATDTDDRIDGIVLDPDDQPIEGVTLVGYVPRPRTSSASWHGNGYEEPDLEDELRQARENALDRRERRRIAKSGTDGTFTIHLPERARSQVKAYLEGYEFESERGEFGEVSEGQLVFRGKPVQWIVLDVRMPDGTQPESAQISFRQDRGNGHSSSGATWTPGAGRVRNPFGDLKLSATAGESFRDFRGRENGAAFRSEEIEVAAGEPGPYTLQLEERRRLSIELVDPSEGAGVPEAWAQVVAGHKFDPEKPAASLERHFDPRWQQGVAKIDGRLVFFDLEPGEWVVVAGRGQVDEHFVPDAIESVQVGDGETRCRVELAPFDPSQYITLTCLDPEGEPVAERPQFQVAHEWTNGSSSSGMGDVVEVEEGVYRVLSRQLEPDPRHQSRGDATTTIRATHDEWGSTSCVVAPQATGLTLQFVVPGTLHVQVVGYERGDYTVQVSPKEDSHRRYSVRGGDGEVDAQGQATLTTITPGEYELLLFGASEDGHSFNRQQLASEPVTIRAGENHARIAIPALYEVRIEAPSMSEGASIRLNVAGERGFSNRRANLDERLVATFENVPAGEYDIASDGLSAPQRISVPPTSHVFEAREMNALRVSISDPAGLLAKSGLQAGDLVYGANGEAFEGMLGIQTVFTKATKESLDLMVDRGGREITVTAGNWGGDMRTLGERMGGMLQPAAR